MLCALTAPSGRAIAVRETQHSGRKEASRVRRGWKVACRRRSRTRRGRGGCAAARIRCRDAPRRTRHVCRALFSHRPSRIFTALPRLASARAHCDIGTRRAAGNEVPHAFRRRRLPLCALSCRRGCCTPRRAANHACYHVLTAPCCASPRKSRTVALAAARLALFANHRARACLCHSSLLKRS